ELTRKKTTASATRHCADPESRMFPAFNINRLRQLFAEFVNRTGTLREESHQNVMSEGDGQERFKAIRLSGALVAVPRRAAARPRSSCTA
ncbi:MAG: hypothetical protein KKE67_18875, partial [Alphaproteobacteria bacterium]|nr:hypothetical protein [Alphaproteobacteria bacterium]MBU0873964.1 hypothetical protein [Alphaproteobacteria bacterium]MBU2145956.1 hypothetical protein [Alphaproteobacteria bacterium]MBU2193067.1 hypothetical protein [Alphaproteobacteria bacterium]MBU2405683.1 hypothetical protein [Alphaproteobacteria bacterium]